MNGLDGTEEEKKNTKITEIKKGHKAQYSSILSSDINATIKVVFLFVGSNIPNI